MLTLERHLDNISNNNDFELLKSIWVLNKKYIRNAQNAIIFNFPHYSLHESSHSNTIIRNIESLLGDERIAQLTPTDTWLILMAAHTHDLGMVIFNNALETKWKEDEFQKYLTSISKQSNDKDLREAAQLLFKLNSQEIQDFELDLTVALKIRKAVILVTADFFRVNHHIRSKEIILGNDAEFNNYLHGFSLTGIPNRFIVVLAEIAYGHGIGFYNVFDRLEYIADGFGGDKMHPRFIAYLLRLGDLLDVDDKRFSIFNERVFADSLPHTSQLHKEKHASVKHLLISPASIEVTVDCMSDEVYRVARGWFDWLQEEVKDQSREWSNIAPKYLTGLPPSISRGAIKILYKSSSPKIDLMNLRFEISNKKVFEMFEGSAIYDYAGFVFIREIVQNAIDASKIQIWKLVNNGYYDNLIRRELKLPQGSTHDEIIKSIDFYFDLPLEIWSNFIIDLKLDWNEVDLIISIQDNGTGISEDDLIRMTKKVGESRNYDEKFQKLKEHMPFWLKPTGAFGIGLQSLFMVSDTFTIQTKSEYEEPKEIQFYSAKNGEYCRITPNNINMRRGTKLIISINKDKFDDIFESKFSIEIINSYDWFDDDYKNVHIHKLISYILDEFKNIELLNVFINNKQIMKSIFLVDNYLELQNGVIHKREKEIIAYLYRKTIDNQTNIYRVFENLGVGSDFTLFFFNTLVENNQNRRHSTGSASKQFVRDIPVRENFPAYYKTSYLHIQWNFESPESDKLLNISRSKFIYKTKRKFDVIFLDNILPKALHIVVNLFEENIEPGEESVAIEFFHIHLTSLMVKLKVSKADLFYQNYTLPKSFATKPDLSDLEFINFFRANKILTISVQNHAIADSNTESIYDIYKELYQSHEYAIDLVLWDFDYFVPYLTVLMFKKTNYFKYISNERSVSISIYELKEDYTPLHTNESAYNQILKNINKLPKDIERRDYLPPIEKYWKQLAVNVPFDEFYFREQFYDNYIISPFKNSNQINDLILKIKAVKQSEENLEIKDHIRSQYLLRLLPDSLINFILSNSSYYNVTRTRESILEAYLSLIIDIISVDNFSINA
ncbi:ATP-binding protein [Spirosoma sp. KNUC1025]|uniref:HD domain-containing protein n=1 Tax=Spirosoma sp. KNUC1025 TaxID=2894082 RepID=UPI003864F266|nr:ATP-binding protein [Spirosoma sp. KNUC1025]